MKRAILITFSLLLLFCNSAWAFEIFQAGIGPYDYRIPAVYEDTIVFMYGGEPCGNYYNEGWDIYGYDIEAKEEFRISNAPANQWSPDIYGDMVVWYDDRTGNNDIYAYDLSRKEELGYEEINLTDNPYDQKNAIIHENIVVWQDNRSGGWDIYGYNLLTDEEFQVSTSAGNQYLPAMDSRFVVWEDDRNGWWRWGSYDIYAYDFETEEEFNIVSPEYRGEHQKVPSVFNNIVVWVDYRGGPDDWHNIYAKDLISGEEFTITTSPGSQYDVHISDRYVVWCDSRDGLQSDVYGYDLLTGEEFPITLGSLHQWCVDIWDDTVVWEECPVGGYWGLYGAVIPEPNTILLLTAGLFGAAGLELKRKI